MQQLQRCLDIGWRGKYGEIFGLNLVETKSTQIEINLLENWVKVENNDSKFTYERKKVAIRTDEWGSDRGEVSY